MSRITTPLRRLFLFSLLMVGVVLWLPGCGGGGKKSAPPPPPPVTSNPGYYDNVSTKGGAIVYQPDNSTLLSIADLQGMVNGSQFTLVSAANNLAYYATFTGLSGNTYTASVAIYKDNIPFGNTTISGTLVAGTNGSLTGTFGTSGTGYGHGTFSLDYSLANLRLAAVSRIVRVNGTIPASWTNNVNSARTSFFQVDLTGVISEPSLLTPKTGIFLGCTIGGNISAVTNTALYQVSMTLTGCTTSTVNGSYAGLATSRTETATDDRLVVTVTSGTYSMDGEFH